MTDILKSIRDITFLFAIYLYFAGWIYRWYYLDYFGLSLAQADMEFYYFFVYAFDVLLAGLRSWMTWLLLGGVLTAWRWKRIHVYSKTGWVILLIVLFPYFFYLAKTSAWNDAQRQAAPETSDLRQVQLVFTPGFLQSVGAADTGANSPAANMRDFLQFNHTGQLRLLLSGKDDVYLLYRQQGTGSVPVIYDLPKGDIQWMAFLGH